MYRKAHSRLTDRSRIILWHVDLLDPIKSSLCDGMKYILTVVNDSRVIYIELIKEKREAAEKLKKLIILMENQSELKGHLKTIRLEKKEEENLMGEFIGINLEE